MKRSLAIFLFVLVFSLPTTIMADPISYSDLWDISQGSVVDSTSGALNYSSGYRSDVRDMFGGNYSIIGGGETLFRDYVSPGLSGGSIQPGYTHYVEWHTPTSVTLRSFNLIAYNEGMNRRAFDHFELYYQNGSGNWVSVYEQDFQSTLSNPYGYGGSPTYNPDSNWLELEVDLSNAVNAQYFRAEFVQAPWTDPRAVGPRILELDGRDTFLDGSTGSPVPEPTSLLLLGTGLGALGLIGFRRSKM